MDASRIHQYIRDFEQCRTSSRLSHPELETRIRTGEPNSSLLHLDSFLKRIDGIYAVDESDYADEETLMRLIQHAQSVVISGWCRSGTEPHHWN